MLKKAAAPKLQEDITTDEELNIFLEKPGLLDIYSEWCGPCLGMIIILRMIRLNVGMENLNYAICKADTIEAFKRFRRKSEPTWLFVTNQKAVNIMFGANAPKLLALINSELELLPSKKRNYYELNEYQPEELMIHNIKEEAINKAIALEREQKEKERFNYLTEVTDSIMEYLPDMGVTVFGPQVQRDSIKRILQIAEKLRIQCKDRKTVLVTREHFEAVHFDCPNPMPDDILDQFVGKELLVCYWKVLGLGANVPPLLQNLAKELQSPQTVYTEDEEAIVLPPLMKSMQVRVEIGDDDISSYKSEENPVMPQNSHEEYFAFYESEDEVEEEQDEEESIEDMDNFGLFDLGLDVDKDQEKHGEADNIEVDPKRKIRTKKVVIPPVWVPDDQRTHAALIYTFFNVQTVGFLPPEPVPEPPYVIMAFDAFKRKDILLHTERYKKDVPMYGFFTSDDANEAKHIASSVKKYKEQTSNDKIVLKVQGATSQTMLKLITYGPSYVSPNALLADEEVSKFFPPDYKTAEDEAKEDELLSFESTMKVLSKRTKRQKHLTSNQSVIEDSSKQTDKVSTSSVENVTTINLREASSGLSKTAEAEAA